MTNQVFVFGSNMAGKHLAGAAHTAYKKYGARWGKGMGHYGDSYALPTLNANLMRLPLDELRIVISAFIVYAMNHPDLEFKVTRVGCGIAAYDDSVVASMFNEAPSNCSFDLSWQSFLGSDRKYWGTF